MDSRYSPAGEFWNDINFFALIKEVVGKDISYKNLIKNIAFFNIRVGNMIK